MTELLYGLNPGCVAQTSADGGTPGQCGRGEVWAVPHRYRFPWPEQVRLYACDHHGRGLAGAEPLNDDDRQIITDRRARREQQLRPDRAARSGTRASSGA